MAEKNCLRVTELLILSDNGHLMTLAQIHLSEIPTLRPLITDAEGEAIAASVIARAKLGYIAGGTFVGAPRFILFKGMNIHGGSPKTDGYQEEHAAGLIGCMTGNSYHYSKNDSYYAYTDYESIDITIANHYKTTPAPPRCRSPACTSARARTPTPTTSGSASATSRTARARRATRSTATRSSRSRTRGRSTTR